TSPIISDAILLCSHLFFLTRRQAFRLQYFWFFTRGLAETILPQLAHLIIVFMVFFTMEPKMYHVWSIAEK
ncbi:MAG: hypothetical protein U9R02_12775, partial [Thermodesulfobacteriota bacterium]|nr:hypothetical protein [Thermodesulfobacteriota bacterium]